MTTTMHPFDPLSPAEISEVRTFTVLQPYSLAHSYRLTEEMILGYGHCSHSFSRTIASIPIHYSQGARKAGNAAIPRE